MKTCPFCNGKASVRKCDNNPSNIKLGCYNTKCHVRPYIYGDARTEESLREEWDVRYDNSLAQLIEQWEKRVKSLIEAKIGAELAEDTLMAKRLSVKLGVVRNMLTELKSIL